jgi:hypothetical protein
MKMLRKLNLNSTHLSPLTFEALKVTNQLNLMKNKESFLGEIASFTRMRYSIYRCLVEIILLLLKNLVHYHPRMETYVSQIAVTCIFSVIVHFHLICECTLSVRIRPVFVLLFPPHICAWYVLLRDTFKQMIWYFFLFVVSLQSVFRHCAIYYSAHTFISQP